MSVIAFERLRDRYEQGNRPAFWLLLALAAPVLMARHITPLILVGRLDDLLLTGSDVLAAMPVLLAAAAVLAVPDRRLIVTGAVLLAAAAVLLSMRHLSPLLGGDTTVLDWLGLAVAPLMVAGPLLIGYGLGGVHTRLGVMLVAGGLIVAVLAGGYALVSAQRLLEAGDALGPALVVRSVIGQFTYFGWAYLLAAAIERRALLMATGAALLILLGIANAALSEIISRQAPGFVLPGGGLAFLLLSLAAWVALIVGVLREFDTAPPAPTVEGEPLVTSR